jgi:hypothetical protein
MISRRQFLALYKAVELMVSEGSPGTDAAEADFYWHLCRPYVCVIHEPTGRGYYLDRSYRLLIDVESIIRPGDDSVKQRYAMLTRVVAHETENGHRPGCSNEPDWATSKPCAEFTTYWLY